MNGTIAFRGKLTAIHNKKHVDAPLSWKIKNTLRWPYIWGWLTNQMAHGFSRLTGIVTHTSELRAVLHHKIPGTNHIQDIDYGVISRRVVTTAGVNWFVDCWQGTYEPETMKYHGAGTGSGSEAVGDTALVTECTTALNPDSTRATGTLAEGASANIFSTVGTLTFDATTAVIEHGLFNQSGTGGGTLWDRSTFSAINVVSGDSITFTYQLTCTAGG